MGLTALFFAVTGAIILFAIKGTEKVSWLPWLDVRALGWVLLLTGAGFAIVYMTPHYHRWRNRE